LHFLLSVSSKRYYYRDCSTCQVIIPRDTRVSKVVSQQSLRSVALYRRHHSNEQSNVPSIFALKKSIQNRLSDRTSMGRDWDSVPLNPSYAVHPTRPQIFSDPSACIRVVAAHFHHTFLLEGWRHVTSELTAAKQRYKGWLFLSPVNEGAFLFLRRERERVGKREGGMDGPISKLSGYFVALIVINATAKWRSDLYSRCNLSLKTEYLLGHGDSFVFGINKYIELVLLLTAIIFFVITKIKSRKNIVQTSQN